MEQTLVYREIVYVIGSEDRDGRAWAIYPHGAETRATAHGQARISGPRGSFKQAVFAAQGAIDQWLDSQSSVAH